MKKLFYLSCFLSLVLLPSCEKDTGLELGKEITLDYRYTVNVDDKIQIRFDELLEDSRCPINSFCQWEGRASIQVSMKVYDQEKVFEFSTLAPRHMDTVFYQGDNQYRFDLESIIPFPTNTFQSPEEYKIIFHLQEI